VRPALVATLLLCVACAPARPPSSGAVPSEVDRACRAEAERAIASRMRANEGRMDDLAGRTGETASAIERVRDLDWITRDRLYRECLARTGRLGAPAPSGR